MINFRYISVILFLLATLSACRHETTGPMVPAGKVTFEIVHKVNGAGLIKNELKYTNTAGNPYMITDLKYFISDITFHRSDGSLTMIKDRNNIFYIDDNDFSSKTISFTDLIPAGSYDSISFIFGISEAKNKSDIFNNPPESYMAWPKILGGGYHYLMMNGKWQDTSGFIRPFNFHLGIGQLYHGAGYDVDSIYAFVQNYFHVNLVSSGFNMKDQQNLTFHISMNIEKWFDSPHVYDFNFQGGAIMQNQAAMQIVKENGGSVFTLTP